jgi:hypothetical protein
MAEPWFVALEEGIAVASVRHVVRSRRLLPAAPPVHCERWPRELEVRTLGPIGIFEDGQPRVFPVKTPRKTLLLLQAIVAQGLEGARESQLMDPLWPASAGDLAQQSLATCLHRLRQLLDVDEDLAT